MSADAELLVLLGAMHLVTLALAGLLIAMFLRSDTVTPWGPSSDDGDDGGGGGGPEPPARPDPGGSGLAIPLADAEPSRVRLRGPGRIARRPARRPAHAPGRRRVPERTTDY